MKNNQILKIFGTEYKEMTVKLLEEADMISHIPADAVKIAVKPNLVAPMPASYGSTTHPEVVAGIIEYLRSKEKALGKQFDIVIMEGSWVGDKTSEAFDVCGYNELAKHYGVKIIDAQTEKFIETDCAGLGLKICECALDTDFMINVPVMKGHCQTKITCALKNMKGLIPNTEKRHFHAMGLHKPIAHLGSRLRQDFIVVDHICGDLDFEDGGNPVVRNCVMAGTDPVLIDSYVCHLLNYDVSEVPYVTMSAELGIGSCDLEDLEIKVIGEDPGEDLPLERKVVKVSDAVQEVDSCSACYAYLIPALDRIREEGNWDKLMAALPDQICIGQGYRGKTGKVGIGNCTCKFEFSVKGCPPVESEIYEALMNRFIRTE